MEAETHDDRVNEEGDEEVVGEENEVDEKREEEEDEEEEQEEAEEEVKPVKKRRCQRRKKIQQICFEDEDELEEEEDLLAEEEEDGEEEEEEESDIESFGGSVLSAITFEWENEIYEFEELCDPGNIDTIYRKRFHELELPDEVGVTRYLQLCRALSIAPTLRIIRSLRTGEMDLSHRNMDSKSIRAMCAALEMNSIVRRFLMKFNKLSEEDCYYIGLMLKANETISLLDFTGCRLGAEGLQLVVEHLPNNEVLVELNLSKCSIRDEGMRILAAVLVKNNSIEKLDLSYNKLGDDSGEPLGTAFKMNSSITDLNLSYNNLFNPSALKGFFRSLTMFNKSITRLNLTWNGLNGQEMGILIGNFLRRNRSIQYLDLSDNRLDGLAVVELKRGLARSATLEVLKMGRNPMSCEDLEALLSGAKACSSLRVLDLENLWVRKVPFLKSLNKILKTKEIDVIYEGIYSNYEVSGPDYPKVILERAQFEAMKPKQEKKKRDFGHLMWTLGEEPLSEEDFMVMVKKFKAKVNKELYPELIKQYFNPRTQLIDVVAMRKKYLSIFPDSTPPPPPKPKKGQTVPEEAPEEPKPEPQPLDLAPSEEEGEELVLDALTEMEDEEGELMIDALGDPEGEYLTEPESEG